MRFTTFQILLAAICLSVVMAPVANEAGPIVAYELISGHSVVVKGDIYEIHCGDGSWWPTTRDDFRSAIVRGTFRPMYIPPVHDDGPPIHGARKPT